MEDRKKIPQPIKIIIIIGLISLIPYAMIKSIPIKEKLVEKNNTYTMKELSYKIPEGFEIDSYSDKEFKTYSYNKDYIYCHISIQTQTNEYDLFKTGADYIKNRVYFTLSDELSEITEKNNWYTITKTTKQGNYETTTVYTNKKNVYIVEFSINDYENGEQIEKKQENKCLTASDYLLKSLKINEN